MSLDVSLYLDIDAGGERLHRCVLFEATYTHNAWALAEKAGIYRYVWKPNDCNDIQTAKDLIAPLTRGIERIEQMESDPALSSWQEYETFLAWLKKYLLACKQHPKALVCAER